MAVKVEVLGESNRLLMCFLVTYSEQGADGLQIVAMANDMQSLVERVRDVGLMEWFGCFGNEELDIQTAFLCSTCRQTRLEDSTLIH